MWIAKNEEKKLAKTKQKAKLETISTDGEHIFCICGNNSMTGIKHADVQSTLL